MIVDTSAVVALVMKEPGHDLILEKLSQSQEFAIDTIPFAEAHWREAVDAYERFGKGFHRASLNFGDCLSHAVAKLAGQPLLAVGGDFPLTDLALA